MINHIIIIIKGPGRGRKKNVDKDKDLNPEEKEKPYACEVCNARYKTRPGLSYHYNHFHNGVMDDQELSQSPKPQRSTRNGESATNTFKRSTRNGESLKHSKDLLALVSQ